MEEAETNFNNVKGREKMSLFNNRMSDFNRGVVTPYVPNNE